MNIYVNLKSAGKRRPAFKKMSYIIPDEISTLQQLIEVIVRQEVKQYNDRGLENMLVPFLTDSEIADNSATGKVSFGRLYSDKKASQDKAVKTALQGFEDGLFRVLIGDHEITELDAPIEIHEGEVLTLIRLAFLAGRLW